MVKKSSNLKDSREDPKTDTKSVKKGSRQKPKLSNSSLLLMRLGLVLLHFSEIDRF